MEQEPTMTSKTDQISVVCTMTARKDVGKEIQRARDTYATPSDNDLEIDAEPCTSIGDDGVWVAAWVWVPFARCEHCDAVLNEQDACQTVTCPNKEESKMHYRPMFEFGPNERKGNAQVFETREEAENSASDRFRVWTLPTGYGVDETPDPVNYRWTPEGGTVSLSVGAF